VEWEVVRHPPSRRRRIVVGHPFWGRGGAEIAATWLIQALHKAYEVHVATRGGWDLASLNATAGTSIPPGAVKVVSCPEQPDWMPGAFGIAAYHRFCRRIAPQYDLRITASRFVDWGLPAIHFLSDVTWNLDLQRLFGSAEHVNRQGMLRRMYWSLAQVLAGSSRRSPCVHDQFVANSRWTAKLSQRYCARQIVTIYPPVLARSSPLPWAEREDGFVLLGRISPEKRVEDAIKIVSEVRERTGNGRIRMYIVGTPADYNYGQHIQSIAKEHPWVILTGPLYGREKEAFVVRQRYAISACDCEAFGMATAEMVALGLVPFVPSKSAQREVVQSDLLCYDDHEDAVRKITEILRIDGIPDDLIAILQRSTGGLDPDVFCENVRALVDETMRDHPALAGVSGKRTPLLL
jgi:glycosyltransferase involved in cell wall biosynthesis